jgi:hypothetical protein
MAGFIPVIYVDAGNKSGHDETGECREDGGSGSPRDGANSMSNGIAGIDHIIIGVRDLEAARRQWRRLGFSVTPRGRHIGQGTANYCVMFGRDYLELLGFVERDEHARRLETFLARREGPMSVAFAPEHSADETAAALGRVVK